MAISIVVVAVVGLVFVGVWYAFARVPPQSRGHGWEVIGVSPSQGTSASVMSSVRPDMPGRGLHDGEELLVVQIGAAECEYVRINDVERTGQRVTITIARHRGWHFGCDDIGVVRSYEIAVAASLVDGATTVLVGNDERPLG